MALLVIPALKKLRQEDVWESDAILAYIVSSRPVLARPSLKTVLKKTSKRRDSLKE